MQKGKSRLARLLVWGVPLLGLPLGVVGYQKLTFVLPPSAALPHGSGQWLVLLIMLVSSGLFVAFMWCFRVRDQPGRYRYLRLAAFLNDITIAPVALGAFSALLVMAFIGALAFDTAAWLDAWPAYAEQTLSWVMMQAMVAVAVSIGLVVWVVRKTTFLDFRIYVEGAAPVLQIVPSKLGRTWTLHMESKANTKANMDWLAALTGTLQAAIAGGFLPRKIILDSHLLTRGRIPARFPAYFARWAGNAGLPPSEFDIDIESIREIGRFGQWAARAVAKSSGTCTEGVDFTKSRRLTITIKRQAGGRLTLQPEQR